MLLAVLESLSRTGKDIESVHVMEALGLFSQETGKSIDLPMGIIAFRQYGWVVFERGMEERQEELPIPGIDFEVFFKKNDMEVPEKRYTKWFDYDKIKRQPEVRYRQTGDYLTLSDGRGGMIHKSLKDYMVTEKIPRQQRGRIPVLAEGSHVLWLVGYRISEYYKVDGNTKRILQAKLEQRVQKSPTEEKNGGTHQSTFIGGRG
jgi:tRNA(Ile)-lysidine synthase